MTMLHLAADNPGLTDLEQKLLVALVSAIIGVSATLLVHFLKARAEPHKRVSWEASADRGFAAIDDAGIQEKLRVTYDGVQVKDIYSIKYKISNTGNRVIKNHRIRFSFPAEVLLLESYLSPTPEPELKVEAAKSHPPEVTYTVGHLERNEEVNFQFVASGESAVLWKAVHSNEEGDVDVERRGAAEKKEDRTHIVPFFISVFLFLTVPYALSVSLIDEPISDALSTVSGFTFLAYALFHLAPVSRAVRDLFSRTDIRGIGRDYTITGDNGSVAVGTLNGSLHYHTPTE
ncbi:hypothetical protein ACWEQH_10965 [Streptomyces sp. NPDC004166]